MAYPDALPHDPVKTIGDDVFVIHGCVQPSAMVRFTRNMVVVREQGQLTLINPVRMDDKGLASLDALGIVKRIMRLGDFHGLDDAFYLDRYQCEFWSQEGQETYKLPKATTWITSTSETPFPNAAFFLFESARFPEAALLLKEHQLLITTDSVQYHKDWSYFTWFTKFAFKLLGFKLGINIGPPWIKRVTPKGGSMKPDFDKLLTLDFDALVAAHGLPLKSGAKTALAEELQLVFK